MGEAPRIELLWWRECPSWNRALAELREEMRVLGLDPDSVEVREVAAEEDAERERFVGSPTIRIDGRDIQPTDEPAGLTCRVYRLRMAASPRFPTAPKSAPPWSPRRSREGARSERFHDR